MSRNLILVSTAPYEVRNADGSISLLDRRYMGKSELEDWICRVVAGGNVVFACRIKLVHRIKIREISDYMMSILGGNPSSSELMRQVLKQALKELGINLSELRTFTADQIMQVNNSMPGNRRKR